MSASGDDRSVEASIVARLRAAGCVDPEAEAAFVRRHLHTAHDVEHAVAARVRGMPLEQAVGAAEFAGVTVAVADGVFVPRARAAAVVEVAAREHPGARVVVDLGCGAGALAAAMAARLPGAEIHAVDIDPAAVVVARCNAWRHGFTPHHGSWWDGLPTNLRGRIDLAVAYLPHVPSGQVRLLPPDHRAHEPRRTVDGGPDGLAPLRTVLGEADAWLAPEGRLVTLLTREQARTAGGRIAGGDDEDAVVVFDRAAVGR